MGGWADWQLGECEHGNPQRFRERIPPSGNMEDSDGDFEIAEADCAECRREAAEEDAELLRLALQERRDRRAARNGE